ncbi:MAG: CHRD domain-containing protein [Rhizobacter sp.]|nr:CHRD domain-containing protein [Ferruginibacter sp.]
MKKYSIKCTTIIALAAIIISSCAKTDLGPGYIEKGFVYFKGDGSYAQMTPVPVTPSIGTAVFSGTYDNSLQILNYSLKWTGMSTGVTKADFFFPSSQVQNGLQARNMFTTTTARPVTDSITGVIWTVNSLTQQELADLKAGKVYYTITTSANTGGEIRGQVAVK